MPRFLAPAVALVLAGGALAAAPVPAGPTDEQLKQTALKLNELTTLDTMNARLRELGKDPAAAKRLVAVAAKFQAAGGKAPPLKYNAALVLGQLAKNQKEYAAAATLYDWCVDHAIRLQSVDKVSLAYPGLADALVAQKKYDAAEEAAQKVLDADFNADRADPQTQLSVRQLESAATAGLVKAIALGGDTDGALTRVDDLLKNNEDAIDIIELKGFVQRQAGKHDDAAATYLDMLKKVNALDRLPDETREKLTQNIRYILTAVYVDAKKTDKAVKILKELVKEDPESATYANDLGFILADANRELDAAEKLVRKALELSAAERKEFAEKKGDDLPPGFDPDRENAAYLDSLGWVLYRKGKFAEALKYLEQAAKDPDDGNHLEIWDHVADCQLGLGKTAEAIATWEKALKLPDVSPRDKDRRTAVKAKLAKAKEKPAGEKK